MNRSGQASLSVSLFNGSRCFGRNFPVDLLTIQPNVTNALPSE